MKCFSKVLGPIVENFVQVYFSLYLFSQVFMGFTPFNCIFLCNGRGSCTIEELIFLTYCINAWT